MAGAASCDDAPALLSAGALRATGVIVGRIVQEGEGNGGAMRCASKEARASSVTTDRAVGEKVIGQKGVTVEAAGDAGDRSTRDRPFSAQRQPTSPRAIRTDAVMLKHAVGGALPAMAPNPFPALRHGSVTPNQMMAWIIHASPSLVKRWAPSPSFLHIPSTLFCYNGAVSSKRQPHYPNRRGRAWKNDGTGSLACW